MDGTLMRHPLLVALFVSIGGLLLASPASTTHVTPATEVVSTDQPEYTQGDTAVIYGQGFAPGSSVIVEVVRVGGSIVTGNGTETVGSDTVTVSASGTFTYLYLIDGGPPEVYDGTLTVNARDASALTQIGRAS